VRLQAGGELDRLGAVARLPGHVEAVLREQRGEGFAGERVVVDDEDALVHGSLIGSDLPADEGDVQTAPARPETYRSWLVGELVLVLLLGGATAYFAATSSLGGYALPQARLALDTAVAVCATIVAILASVRFRVE